MYAAANQPRHERGQIRQRSHHWPTPFGDFSIRREAEGIALRINGHLLGHHPSAHAAAQAVCYHRSGNSTWDSSRLSAPPLQAWGQVIRVGF